ncbi:MAG: EamA family transporter [Mesorhizobium sp.]|uniref:DMT family transporter n=1 Tax=Mesorhizobium sp. TaxID=1871066 RepID=UPI000FE83DCA|nr:EamA family transporter [Mesorhizobium sp.]RWI50253.1 MAG: EamA family transporter [Mesorhizobium sp.]
MTAFFYALTVLIWGTTWIAIHYQLGIVPVEASVVYRFALAGMVLFMGLGAFGLLSAIPRNQQPWIVLQGLCLFSCNFICFYVATGYIPSGLVSVVFSAATIFNMINAFLFQGRRPSGRILAGASLGVVGIACLFSGTLAAAALDFRTIKGLALALLGTWFFSAGNLVSARNQRNGLQVATVNAWAMLYGAAIVALFAFCRGVPFAFDASPIYVGSLLYLAIPGSVIAFTTYLTVVHRLGPERAAYMTVLFPVVALSMSVLFENYTFTPVAGFGLGCVLLGNVLVLTGPRLHVEDAGSESDDGPRRS